jgi:FkbM family methyltransferase
MIIGRLKSLKRRHGMFKKVDALPIASSGVDTEGDPFVVLQDGTIFFGSSVSRKRDKVLYKILSKKTKSVLKPECTQVAIDVMIRYVEGGLMYNGPKKQSRYKVNLGDKVAEMGAYQGFCSVKLAQQVGENGHVVAIEPMPDNYRLLTKNMKANNFTQSTTVNKGVWDESKTLIFNRVKGDGQSSSIEMTYDDGDKFEVSAETLDTIFGEVGVQPSDYMIIQLNGAEINGLRGLQSFKPKNLTIAARYDTEGEDAAIVIKEELIKRGYEVEIDEDDFLFAKLK